MSRPAEKRERNKWKQWKKQVLQGENLENVPNDLEKRSRGFYWKTRRRTQKLSGGLEQSSGGLEDGE